MEWRLTEKILRDYCEEALNMLKDMLVDKGHVYTGDLVNNMFYDIVIDDEHIEAYLMVEDYFKYLDEGIKPAGKYENPGWKAFPFIMEWVENKPVVPTTTVVRKWKLKDGTTRTRDTGQLPTVKQLSAMITRKLAEDGREPEGMRAELLSSLQEKYAPLVEEAIRQDIEDEVSDIIMNAKIW